jgi:cell division protease FtsH
MEKRTQYHVWYAIAAFIGLLLIQNWWHAARTTEIIPYSDFQAFLDQGKVGEILITESYIRGEFKEPIEGKTNFVTSRVDPNIAAQLESKGVKFTGGSENNFLTEMLSSPSGREGWAG